MTIDSHCHIHDEKFSADIEDVLTRATNAQITHLVTIGCDLETTSAASAMAKRYNQVFFTAGFHPHEAKHLNDDALLALRNLAEQEKCVAIGECGLDYYYLHSSVDEQRHALRTQLALAEELDLPVVIHLRDAFDDLIQIMKDFPKRLPHTVIHCFSGTTTEAKIFSDLGCYISLSGIITFKKPGDLPAVAKETSVQQLLAETDCPYLAPHPHRGKRNEPAYINFTLEAIAAARGESVNAVAEQIHQNTMKLFRLPTLP